MFRFGRRPDEDELDQEIQAHLAMAALDRMDRGEEAEQAASAVRKEFGNVGLVKEVTREVTSFQLWNGIARDARYACHALARTPVFTVIALLLLAFGIGANSAIYGVIHATLIRALPFPNSQQLVRLYDSYGTPGNFSPVSYPNYRDWNAWSRSFQAMAAFRNVSYTLTGSGEALHVEGLLCSANFFKVLQARPLIGRTFSSTEDRPYADDGADAVILSHRVWTERFNRSKEVLGRRILLDGKPFLVIGVMPAGFDSYVSNGREDFWVTTAVLAQPAPGSPRPVSEERGISFLNVIGRLKPHRNIRQAQADMDRVAALLMRFYPKDAGREGVIVRDFRESLTGDLRGTLLLLFGAAAVLLFIACSNLAGLLSARTMRRHRELCVRAALGAARGQLIRQLSVENAVLCCAGLILGLCVAFYVRQLLCAWLELPERTQVISWPLFAFAAIVAVGAMFALSLVPALYIFRADLINGLKTTQLRASDGKRQRRAEYVLLLGQIALAVVLLSGSLLFTRALMHLETIDLGFEPEHALSFPVTLAEPKYAQKRRAFVFAEILARLARLPGVQHVGAGSEMPLSGSISNTVLDNVGGRAIPQSEWTGITFCAVSGDYFRALGIKLHAGRLFNSHDRAGSEPVAIVNQAAVRKYFGAKNPVGQQVEPLMWNGAGSVTQPRTVVGVVGDLKLEGVAAEPRPMIFWPLDQVPSSDSLAVVVRTVGDPLRLLSGIRSALGAIDKDLPLYDVHPLTASVASALSQPRHVTALVSVFGMLALLLSVTGIFGAVAYEVTRRTREIGIRMALGAQPWTILRQLTGQVVMLTVLGVLLGIPITLTAARWLQGTFFGINVEINVALLIAGIGFVFVATVASLVPALSALRADPVATLRYE